jgi:hypothetical protein
MNTLRVVAWGLMLTAGLSCSAVSAQTGPPTTAPAPVFTPAPNMFPPGYSYSFGIYQNTSESSQLAQQYVKATKEEEKRDIRKKLTDVLAKQFDQHVQKQQKELEDLEKQIADLRALVKKRQGAKEKIVERRIDQLVQEAEGLGWNAPGSPHPGVGYGAAPRTFYRSATSGTSGQAERPAPEPVKP